MKHLSAPSMILACLSFVLMCGGGGGCSSSTRDSSSAARMASSVQAADLASLQLQPPTYWAAVQSEVTPPVGWRPDPLKISSDHTHQVWLSPTGRTAYGVILFHLPLPVGHEVALRGFMAQMRRTEGQAQLISKHWD